MAKSAIKTGVIGSWAFLIGVILAVVFGIIGGATEGIMAIVLAIIGLIVGILNVTDKEATPFLMSGVVLIIASALGKNDAIAAVPYLGEILTALLVIFVPATIIVAVKNVFSLARN